MSGVVKTIVLWFIALAIPLQGMAATVFPLCPTEHHAPALLVVAQLPADELGAADHASMVDHHQHHQQPDAVSLAAADAPVSHDAELLGHGMLNCCSAAGAMLALGVPSVPTLPALRSPEPLPPAAQADLGVTLDGLERPPKNILV
ncbi:hypothetical protein [Piscinibacter sakaiensis]|uniref:hypothetical protein n=1 Tax=Piscinibacter sakaiensis TaxID=1547922 RepID=UPI003AAC6341